MDFVGESFRLRQQLGRQSGGAPPPSASTQAEGGYLFNDQMGTFLTINLLSPTPQVGTFSMIKSVLFRLTKTSEYATIIEVARRLPEDVLQEDPALLMYDANAVMRQGQ